MELEEKLKLYEKQAQKLVNMLYKHPDVIRVDIEAELVSGTILFKPHYRLDKNSFTYKLGKIDPQQVKKELNSKIYKILDYLGIEYDLWDYFTFFS